jgi:hypothetical protein
LNLDREAIEDSGCRPLHQRHQLRHDDGRRRGEAFVSNEARDGVEVLRELGVVACVELLHQTGQVVGVVRRQVVLPDLGRKIGDRGGQLRLGRGLKRQGLQRSLGLGQRQSVRRGTRREEDAAE